MHIKKPLLGIMSHVGLTCLHFEHAMKDRLYVVESKVPIPESIGVPERGIEIAITNPYRDLQMPAMASLFTPVRSKRGGSPREWGENYKKKRK